MKKVFFFLFFPITLPIWLLKKALGVIFKPQSHVKTKKQSKSNIQVTIKEIDDKRKEVEGVQVSAEIGNHREPSNHTAICDGLTADQVLLLSYAEGYDTENPSFQQFWRSRYSLSGTELRRNLEILKDFGFIAEPTTAESLWCYKVKDLRIVLEEHGISASGKKDNLIQLLIENVDEQDLKRLFRKKNYVITPSGKSVIEKYPYIRYVHSHDAAGYDIWSIAEAAHESRSKNWRDIVWQRYSENLRIASQKTDLVALRWNYVGMADFLLEEGKQKTALSVYCEIARLDIQSAEGWRKKEEIIDDNNAIAPGIKTRIREILITLNIPEELQKGEIVDELKQRTKEFSVDEIADMILK